MSSETTKSLQFAVGDTIYQVQHRFQDTMLGISSPKEVITITVIPEADTSTVEYMKLNQRYENKTKRKSMFDGIAQRTIEVLETLRK